MDDCVHVASVDSTHYRCENCRKVCADTMESPQFFSSFVLASGVAGYRLELGIYRRAHSFLLAGHFIRTGSWVLASLRLTSSRPTSFRLTSPHPHPWAISYKCVVNYLPRGRDTAVLLHRCSSPPILATSLLLHRPVTSTDCLPTAPSTPLFLSPAPSSRLSRSLTSSLDRASSLFTPSPLPPTTTSSSFSSSSGTLWRRVLRKLMFIWKTNWTGLSRLQPAIKRDYCSSARAPGGIR